MKLRNKKTGEIKECVVIPVDDNGYPNEYQVFEKGDSLAELNADWEDYEEPNGYYGYDTTGNEVTWYPNPNQEDIEKDKQIGNYFETEEEAEKAVEKLKAWKRLKDKGFVFKGINKVDGSIKTGLSKGVSVYECEGFYEDMDLLFGVEE